MNLTAMDIVQDLELVRAKSPLVHNITNYVVMDSTANALLAVGASPVMAHAAEEVEEMVSLAGALVLNIGTLCDPGSRPWPRRPPPPGARACPSSSTRWAPAPPAAHRDCPLPDRGGQADHHPGQRLRDHGPGRDWRRTKGVDCAAAAERRPGQRPSRAASRAAWCVTARPTTSSTARRHRRGGQRPPPDARVTGLGCTATALIGAFAAVEPDPCAADGRAMAVMALPARSPPRGRPGPAACRSSSWMRCSAWTAPTSNAA